MHALRSHVRDDGDDTRAIVSVRSSARFTLTSRTEKAMFCSEMLDYCLIVGNPPPPLRNMD